MSTSTFTFIDDSRSNVRGTTYRAAIYCVPCTVQLLLEKRGIKGHGLSHIAQEALDLLGRFELDSAWREQNEHEWDSDDFPKIVHRDMVGEDFECCDKCGWDILGRA